METCENCGRVIGAAEPFQYYDGQIVCGTCLRALQGNNPALDALASTIASRNATMTTPRPQKRQRARGYVDYLLWPRLILLLLAIAAAFLLAKEWSIMLFGAWMLLGLANLVMKAIYRQNHG
jgi:hypothetical protein